MSQMTPFARRMEQIKNTIPVNSPMKQAMTLPPLMKGLSEGGYSEGDLEYNSKRGQLEQKFNNNKDQVNNLALELRNQVQQGLISPAEAELRIDAMVDDIADKEYSGYKEASVQRKAAKFSANNPNISGDDAYNMYKQGYDPEKFKRADNKTTQNGILGAGVAQ